MQACTSMQPRPDTSHALPASEGCLEQGRSPAASGRSRGSGSGAGLPHPGWSQAPAPGACLLPPAAQQRGAAASSCAAEQIEQMSGRPSRDELLGRPARLAHGLRRRLLA